MLFRMSSTLVAVRELQFSQAPTKQLLPGVPVQSSKKFAGKVSRLMQVLQLLLKLVAATGLLPKGSEGNDVNAMQVNQALARLIPADRSMGGNDVRLPQLYQALVKFVTFDVSSSENDVKLGQSRQVSTKFVTADVSISPTVVRLLEPLNARYKLFPKLQPVGVSPNVISSSPAGSIK